MRFQPLKRALGAIKKQKKQRGQRKPADEVEIVPQRKAKASKKLITNKNRFKQDILLRLIFKIEKES